MDIDLENLDSDIERILEKIEIYTNDLDEVVYNGTLESFVHTLDEIYILLGKLEVLGKKRFCCHA